MKQTLPLPLPLPLLLLATFTESLHIPLEFSLKSAANDVTHLFPSEIKECPIGLPFSCTNTTVIEDSCCFEYPGGILLQTQFWDYYPAVGPDDLFTLHGLWPDLCDGQYEQFCDKPMEITNVRSILKEHGEDKLLEKMINVWKDYNGNDESLWVHEFNKHGTCMSTIKNSCYSKDSKPQQNVVDFFKKNVDLFEQLPTFQWLADNGIIPSNEQTYTKKQIEDTLTARFGQPVFIKCNKYHAIQEVWYFHHLRGSIVRGEYQPIPALMDSQCPESGIKFIPKKGFAPPKPTNTHPGSPHPTGKPMTGHLKPENYPGCIISNGNWYASGTCAKFSIYKAEFGGYNIKSSKGYCKIGNEGYLLCGSSISPMQFEYDKEKQWIKFGGKTRWSADQIPTGFKQVSIRPGYDGPIEFHLKLVE
jgi:ribonuclease T2